MANSLLQQPFEMDSFRFSSIEAQGPPSIKSSDQSTSHHFDRDQCTRIPCTTFWIYKTTERLLLQLSVVFLLALVSIFFFVLLSLTQILGHGVVWGDFYNFKLLRHQPLEVALPGRSDGLAIQRFITSEMASLPSTSIAKLNKGIQPIHVHSHNDYTQRTPLFHALSLGVQSIEADIWHLPGTVELLVGHKRNMLSTYRTLKRMYLDPLEAMLDEQNQGVVDDGSPLAGVFHSSPDSSLNVVLDLKNDPEATVRYLRKELQGLWLKGYITHYNTITSEWVHGPLTFILSGKATIDTVRNQGQTSVDFYDYDKKRMMFLDAPLHLLNATEVEYSHDNGISVLASASLMELTGSNRALSSEVGSWLSEEQKSILQERFQVAHKLGMQTRVWETPEWPMNRSIGVMEELVKLGSDWINADNLDQAASM